MRSICLYFQVHQPYRLRTYRFFNIGSDHNYYDDYQNRQIVKRVAEKCYLPANKLMLDLVKEYGSAFKISFSISGTAIEQLQEHAPEVINGFRQLAKTGCVEFLAEPYAHSLASLGNREEFISQVERHSAVIEDLFGKKPKTFRNTELIYSDAIGEMVTEMGFNLIITEGAKHILGWKSPNYMYCSTKNPKLKILLRNFRLSDDIAFRFSTRTWAEWPLTAEKFAGWLNGITPREEVVNVFLDYETIGERQWKETGIFDFFRALPKVVLSTTNFKFATPSELMNVLQPVAPIHVPYPISWADEERDLTSWLGNELQDEAFSKLYSAYESIIKLKDPDILKDWLFLQTTDHFYYMCTKWFSNGTVHKYFNPYPSPYEAFINYMNVLSDFLIRVENAEKNIGIKIEAETETELEKVKKPITKDKPKAKAKVEEPLVEKKKGSTTPKTTTGRLVVKERVKEIKKSTTPAKARSAAGTARKSTEKEKTVEKSFKALNIDDIITLSDAKVKKIIKELEIGTITSAMKGADKKIRDKVEKNLGKRALKSYQELWKGIKKLSESEVRKSRRLFESQFRKHTK